MTRSPEIKFQFEISLSVLNHLGRNLYRNFITVLGEAISNSWDADACNIWISIDKENSIFSIKDDGVGMTAGDFQSKFLKIGYSKRKGGNYKTGSGRPFIGAKGIGKLALLSCAKKISIFTKTDSTRYVGGVIDNSGLDKAIKHDLVPDEYPLDALNYGLIEELSSDHEKGTILVFEGINENLRSSVAHIKKLLALSFKFSLLDDNFNIFVNDELVTISDLKDLMETTEFLWLINQYRDDYVQCLTGLKAEPITVTSRLNLKGFIASVVKPRHLKISGTEERATIDLFVNGRLREKNIIRHIPTQRIIESYIYGQIHFDIMDHTDSDPFTSSREGIVEDDKNFQSLLKFLKSTLLPKILDEWDELRLNRGFEGDDENKRKTLKARKAANLYAIAKEEYKPEDGAPGKDHVEEWMKELRPDAEFNISAYVDCFLSENLVRKYIQTQGIKLSEKAIQQVVEFKKTEEKNKGKANISFTICKDNNDLYYLGMDVLAINAEGSKSTNGQQSLWLDAINYKPVRNAVGHTGLLTRISKNHLNIAFENIKFRVKYLLSQTKE